MEQNKIANNINEFKKILGHTIGGSVYVTKECAEALRKLDGLSTSRLCDELECRFVKIKIIKK